MRKLLIFVTGLMVLFLVGIKFSQAQTQRILCLDPKAHLIWPSPQSANVIPMRSANSADTLTNSPVSVNGSNVGVSGNLSATGNVSGANICVGASCVSNWSQVSGPWTKSGNNLYPTNTSTNVGLGRSDPQYKLDVNGTFRVMVNGEERFAIKENPPTASTRNPRLAQVKPANAQTTTDRWVQLFGGAAYFLKRGTNSDVFLRVGNKDTTLGSVQAKGREPNLYFIDENNLGRTKIWHNKARNSTVIQSFDGITDQNQSIPTATLELNNGGGAGNLPKLKFFGGDTASSQRLILEITEE